MTKAKDIPQKEKRVDRILYLSDTVPPFTSGSTVIMHRLLSKFPDESYVLLSRSAKPNSEERIDEELWLPGHYVYAMSSSFWRFFSKLQSRSSVWKWLQTLPVFVRGMQVVVREKSVKHLLVAPSAFSGTFLLATCWLHCITRIPMSVYFFDMFDRGQKTTLEDRMRCSIEGMAIRLSSNVFVMSEPLQEHYDYKYGIESVLLPHPVDLTSYALPDDGGSCIDNKPDLPLRIVFSGMIYEAQLDAILNLVQVVNESQDMEFHIYSPITEAKRRWMGITGDNVVFHGAVSHSEIPGILQGADILFLPVAFDYIYANMIEEMPADKLREQRAAGREVIRTASPSKFPEYLAAGRPILIHAPEFSYVVWYGKTHRCAEVVDTPDLKALRNAVLRLQNDKSYCDLLATNARKAVAKHDATRISEVLQQCLGVTM